MDICKISRASSIPLIGHIAFGLILRPNSNVIQVRATTMCNMNCPFCSTDGGPFSTTHQTHYVVDPEYMVEWIKKISKTKGSVHINIDSVGEPTMYPHLEKLIALLKKEKTINFISMQSNGTSLTEKKIKGLEAAGLNRIHLSIHSMDQIKSRKLFGSNKYNIADIKQAIKTLKKSKIEVLLAPVWLPKVNDHDIEELITFAKENNLRIALQKYEKYKYSRKMREAKKINYYKFYKQLKEWERKFNMQLVFNAQDLNTRKAQNIPLAFKISERSNATIVAQGWMKNQMIATAKNRCVTVNNCNRKIGDKVNIKIRENKNNIYLAEMA